MSGLMRIALSILLVAGIGKAQIPVPCADATNFRSKECCPTPTNVGTSPGPCGMNLTPPRGQCVDIPIPYNAMILNGSEPRQNWPHFYFNRTCNCTSNYGGYDCGECAFGYRGPTCNERYTRRRRSTSELTDQEWSTYITQLQMAKSSSTSRYKVITSQPDYNDLAALQTQHIGLYNLFVWFHHYIAKDNLGNNPPDENDYAHEATGFPTWHRLFLLWFEREMQIMTGDDNFTVHYWDWRDRKERRSLFTRDRLGEHDTNNAALTGRLVDNSGWQTVCWYEGSGNERRPDVVNRICDPSTNTGPLQRCPIKRTCKDNYEGWPSYEDVDTAVRKQDYDSPDYNKYSREGFRGFMEGFDVLDGPCDSNSDRGRDLCTNVTIDGMKKGLQRQLHNTIHIILGMGTFNNNLGDNQKGVMGDVAASANDPIFINHHAMVDCILEKWLQNNIARVNYPPVTSIRAGHRRNDYIVPFIPLYTHNMMFKRAEDLGYTCNLPDLPTTPTPQETTTQATAEPDSAKPATALLYVLVLAIVGSATFILYF